MADTSESVFDKAESLARRILERLGTTVDIKFTKNEHSLNSRVIASLASRLENAIESNLREDENGVKRLAPNQFKVQFTYEETSKLTPQYIELVGSELTAIIFEYIINRRYLTLGPVVVEATQDLFAGTTGIKASFSEANSKSESAASAAETKQTRTISFLYEDGHISQLQLTQDQTVYVGRVAGNALRIEDPSVSRMHCSISNRADGNVVIADIGSANGTFINDELIQPNETRSINKGDSLTVGDFKLKVAEIF